jgi:hypothetical protein
MLGQIEEQYTKKNNNWFCTECHGEIYSGKKLYKSLCSCSSKIEQQSIYTNYLKQYYLVQGNEYICNKCNMNIKSTREKHALNCKGLGTRDNPSPKAVDPSLFSPLCDLGCGQKSNFFYKSGKAYCSHMSNNCPVKKEKDRLKKINSNNFLNYIHPNLGKVPHNKGLTKENSEVVARGSLAIKKAFELHGDKRKNKNHTAESKAKLSEKIKERYASGWEPICGRAKKYKHSSPIAGEISVDGTWELSFAQMLDKIEVKWIRNKKRFDYINLEGEESTYQPDFFVYEWNTFIEVKGYQTDLDNCKWRQFNEPLLVVKKNHIRKIKQWLKEDKVFNKGEIYELIKDSTKENNLSLCLANKV